MIIYYNIKPQEPYGGAFTFAKHLIKCFESKGHKIVFDLNSNYHVGLVTAYHGGKEIIENINTPFVHRMDGLKRVYANFFCETDYLQKEINDHAIFTIFQSRFSKESSNILLDTQRPNTIILNGTDLALFHPARFRLWKKLRVISCSWSENKKKGFGLMETISKNKNINVSFIGRWNKDYDASNIKIISVVTQKKISRILRKYDVFFAPSQDDSCSNTLIESIASGLIPLYLDSGGHHEIVGDCGVTINNLDKNIEEIMDKRKELREKTLKRRRELDIDKVADSYLEVLKQYAK